MTAARRRPHSANQLQRVVRAYAREYGLAEKRVRDWTPAAPGAGCSQRIDQRRRLPYRCVQRAVLWEGRLKFLFRYSGWKFLFRIPIPD